ncbi:MULTISPECIES: hypothetical protein [Thermocrispum]|uniref:Uncharacterized protein n=1 Tax=Thermocrispum agreste TaxID=37925 RepID=A0ABD6FJ76_9PSEU|nr:MULTISPECIES: hypothetical protein [Thermocrispum]
MTEHALREGMRAAVTAEPPLGFSTDELIATARRRARRRRTMMASAATAAVVVAGSVGAVSLAGQQEPGPARLQAAAGDVVRGEVEKAGESLAQLLPRYLPGAEVTSTVAIDDTGLITYEVDDAPGACCTKSTRVR